MNDNQQAIEAGATELGMTSPSIRILQEVARDHAPITDTGTPVSDLSAPEVTGVTIILDNTGSIANLHLQEAVCVGFDNYLRGLEGLEARGESFLVSVTYLDGREHCAFVPPVQVPRLSATSYDTSLQQTPLRDAIIGAIAKQSLKASESVREGTSFRSVVVVLTDGLDNCSAKSVADARTVITDYLRTSGRNQLVVIGVGGDFTNAFRELGANPKYILTAGTSAQEMAAACRRASQMSVAASPASAAMTEAGAGAFAQ